MVTDTPIFGLRFNSNEAIQPSVHELKAFLESPIKEGRRERHGDDLDAYVQRFQAVEEFERRLRRGAAPDDIREKMLFSALVHTHFYKPALKFAVELFKYHRHQLGLLDFKKPRAFIKSAEEEMGRLNPKKKDDALKLARFQGMIDDRKKDLEQLTRRWTELAAELVHIAQYVRENLARIQKLCETSIAVLVDLQVGRKKEHQLIEDIKTHFKDQVRDSLQLGPVTKEYVESLKETVARLSKQMSLLLLEDVYAMTGLYEAIHDHARSSVERIDGLTGRIEKKEQAGLDEERELFAGLEQALVGLVSGLHAELKPLPELPHDLEHEAILVEKRKELLSHLFDLLYKGSAA